MDRDSIIMRIAFAIIIGVLCFYVYKWWLGTKSSYVSDPDTKESTDMMPPPPAADKPPQGAGVTMYGSDSCPWCTKQKDYFKEKGTEYTFVDCAQGQCPNFVSGFPTIVVNGEIKVGYQEI
jgi:glutaredoxin